jgi:hypothetical protein
VTDVVVTLHLGERGSLPLNPKTIGLKPEENMPEAYLLHDQSFGVVTSFERFGDTAWQQWRYGKSLTMWLVGYADYIDTFGERRRRGVAYFIDRFDQAAFEYEPSPNYNYDRKRKQGEGRDWKDSAS